MRLAGVGLWLLGGLINKDKGLRKTQEVFGRLAWAAVHTALQLT